MKENHLFLQIGVVALMVLLALSACSKKEFDGSTGGGGTNAPVEVQKATITLDTDQFVVQQEGGTLKISFTSTGKWTAQASSISSGWCQMNSASGMSGRGEITVLVMANSTYDERNASVLIATEGAQRTVTITQKQCDALMVSSNKVEMKQGGGIAKIEVQANVDYKVTVSAEAKKWIEPLQTRGLNATNYSFQVAPNNSRTTRQGTVEIEGQKMKEVVRVYQLGTGNPEPGWDDDPQDPPKPDNPVGPDKPTDPVNPPKPDEPTDPVNPPKPDEPTDPVNPDEPEEPVNPDKPDDPSEPTKPDEPEEPSTLVLSQNHFTVPSAGESLTIEVISNSQYEMTLPDVDWISEDKERGVSYYTRYLVVAPNEGYDNRTAKVKFTNLSNQESEYVTIDQVCKDALIVAQNSYTLDSKEQELSFDVNTTNKDFEVKTSADWIVNRSTRALETVPLKFLIKANESTQGRSGTIQLISKDVKQDIVINQTAAKNTLRLAVVHEGSTLDAPELTGGTDCVVDWGDGVSEAYSPGISHSYTSEGKKTVTFEGDGITQVKIKAIGDITHLDFAIDVQQ